MPGPAVTIDDLGSSYTVAEAARMFNRDAQTVRRWIRAGKLDAYRVGGGAAKGELRITRRALTEYLNKGRVQCA